AGGVGDGADPDVVQGRAQGGAAGAVCGGGRALDQILGEARGQDADDALQQQVTAALQQSGQVVQAPGGGQGLQQALDDEVGEDIGEPGELVVEPFDQVEHLVERDAGGGAIGDQRQQRGAADGEVVSVRLDEAGGDGAVEGGAGQRGQP